jgi:iron complex outermembrane receptor protein
MSVASQHFLSTDNSLKWQLNYTGGKNTTEWRRCEPLLDLRRDLIGSPYVAIFQLDQVSVCGDVNNSIRADRVDLDVEDTWVASNTLKLVSGIHGQYQNVVSETYYSGSAQRDNYQLFANLEYRFLPKWSATIAGSHDFFNDGDHAFSPRLALLYFPSENHSLRAVYSEAIRTPDLFETDAQWHYIARNISIASAVPLPSQLTSQIPSQQDLQTFSSPDHVRPERIRSRELGYYGLWWNRRLEWDIKLFNDDMDDLISDPPSYGDYNPVNYGVVKQRGYETELKWAATDKLQWHLSGAMINSDSNTYKEENLTPHHSGSAAVLYEFLPSWHFSSFYYYAYPINSNKFQRWDNRIAKQIDFSTNHLTLSMVVQHYFHKDTDLFDNNLYYGPNRIYFSADLNF